MGEIIHTYVDWVDGFINFLDDYCLWEEFVKDNDLEQYYYDEEHEDMDYIYEYIWDYIHPVEEMEYMLKKYVDGMFSVKFDDLSDYYMIIRVDEEILKEKLTNSIDFY